MWFEKYVNKYTLFEFSAQSSVSLSLYNLLINKLSSKQTSTTDMKNRKLLYRTQNIGKDNTKMEICFRPNGMNTIHRGRRV